MIKMSEESNFSAETVHPKVKVEITDIDNKEHIVVQNTQYSPLGDTKLIFGFTRQL